MSLYMYTRAYIHIETLAGNIHLYLQIISYIQTSFRVIIIILIFFNGRKTGLWSLIVAKWNCINNQLMRLQRLNYTTLHLQSIGSTSCEMPPIKQPESRLLERNISITSYEDRSVGRKQRVNFSILWWRWKEEYENWFNIWKMVSLHVKESVGPTTTDFARGSWNKDAFPLWKKGEKS